MEQRTILIAGPTASGKSALALRLAETLASMGGADIVNADSMQVYSDLRVLTARPGEGEIARAPHHLYGIRRAWEPCSAGIWAELAAEAIAEIHAAGRAAIVVGGTGLYFRALTEGLAPIPAIASEIRDAARQRMRELGPERFHAMLAEADPQTASGLRPSDSQRLSRAWEVLQQTGVSLSEWQARPGTPVLAGRAVRIALSPPRDWLYERCDRRFDEMISAGAMEEVAALDRLARAKHLPDDLPVLRALGMPQLRGFVRGEVDRDTALTSAKTATRRYAKRQLTWIRRQMISWSILCTQDSQKIFSETFSKIVAEGLTPQD